MEEDGCGTLFKCGFGRLVFQTSDTVRRGIESALVSTEGEIVLRGEELAGGALPFVSLRGGIVAGSSNRASGSVASAGFVFDRMSASVSSGVIADAMNDPAATMNEAYLVVSNKSQVTGNFAFINEYCRQNTELKVWVLVDDAVLSAGANSFALNAVCPTRFAPRIMVRNGAELRGGLTFSAGCDVDVDHAKVCPEKDANGNEYEMAVAYRWYDRAYTNNLTFANGSVLRAHAVRCANQNSYTPPQMNFTFDDSEWQGMANGFWGYVKPGTANNPYVTVKMRGKGLIVNVPESATYVWAFPTVDADSVFGGFVKRGAGTLRVGNEIDRDGATYLDRFAFGHTGRTIVEAGVLDLDGKIWEGATIGGGEGTFANGTLSRMRLALDVADGVAKDVPNFASTISFSGVTKIDFGGEVLPVGTVLTVANYTGTAPDVSRWRIVNGGKRSASFVAQDGHIRATIGPKLGFVLSIR